MADQGAHLLRQLDVLVAIAPAGRALVRVLAATDPEEAAMLHVLLEGLLLERPIVAPVTGSPACSRGPPRSRATWRATTTSADVVQWLAALARRGSVLH